MSRRCVGILLIVLTVVGCAAHKLRPRFQAVVNPEFAGATPLQWSCRLADAEIARRGDSLEWKSSGKTKWDYATGLFTLSLIKLNDILEQTTPEGAVKYSTSSSPYVTFAKDVMSSFITANGRIRGYNRDEFQLDSLNPGKTALALWRITNDRRYRDAAYALLFQLSSQPRTLQGGFWHKQRYTNQMWLDGIYMCAPFYTECGRMFDEASAFNDAAMQVRLIDLHTYDARTGLNYHGWDADHIQPWANQSTGCSSNFWGRAEGWYAMALVDMLDYLPENHPDRQKIISIFQKAARGIVKWQDPNTGLWWQVMDQGNRQGNYQEATASTMFVYALAKGVNQGYLPRSYIPAINRAYAGIIQDLVQRDAGNQWSLIGCCSVAGLGTASADGKSRDGSFNYYVSEPVVVNDLKGIGPFILAGIELQKLARTNIQ